MRTRERRVPHRERCTATVTSLPGGAAVTLGAEDGALELRRLAHLVRRGGYRRRVDLTDTTWRAALVVVGGLVLALLVGWLLLLAVLWRVSAGRTTWRDALRLLPDLVRLVRRLAADRDLPRGVRVRLWLLLGYLALPIDLVPDVLPVIGWADDVLAVVLVLRSVVRRAGPVALERHWPGTPEGLAAVRAACGLGGPTPRSRADAEGAG